MNAINRKMLFFALLCACFIPQSGIAQKSLDGVTYKASGWQAIKPHQILINIFDLKDVRVSQADWRARNNGELVQHRAWFDDRKGHLYLEHIMSYGVVYNIRTTHYVQDPKTTKKYVERYCRHLSVTCDYEALKKIHVYNKRGGWARLISIGNTNSKCIIAQVGFLSTGKWHTRPDEHYDTSMDLRDCSGKRSFDDVVKWLKDVNIAPEGYNPVQRSTSSNVVSKPAPAKSAHTPIQSDDQYVCRMALNHDHTGWANGQFQRHVAAVKHRGLTVADCRRLLKSGNEKSTQISEATKPVQISSGPSSERRSFAVQWEGKESLIAGHVEIPKNGVGKLTFTLPDNDGKCSGTFMYSDGKKGVWSAACTSGETASGTFKALGAGKGSTGVGTDNNGRSIQFTIGAR